MKLLNANEEYGFSAQAESVNEQRMIPVTSTSSLVIVEGKSRNNEGESYNYEEKDRTKRLISNTFNKNGSYEMKKVSKTISAKYSDNEGRTSSRSTKQSVAEIISNSSNVSRPKQNKNKYRKEPESKVKRSSEVLDILSSDREDDSRRQILLNEVSNMQQEAIVFSSDKTNSKQIHNILEDIQQSTNQSIQKKQQDLLSQDKSMVSTEHSASSHRKGKSKQGQLRRSFMRNRTEEDSNLSAKTILEDAQHHGKTEIQEEVGRSATDERQSDKINSAIYSGRHVQQENTYLLNTMNDKDDSCHSKTLKEKIDVLYEDETLLENTGTILKHAEKGGVRKTEKNFAKGRGMVRNKEIQNNGNDSESLKPGWKSDHAKGKRSEDEWEDDSFTRADSASDLVHADDDKGLSSESRIYDSSALDENIDSSSTKDTQKFQRSDIEESEFGGTGVVDDQPGTPDTFISSKEEFDIETVITSSEIRQPNDEVTHVKENAQPETAVSEGKDTVEVDETLVNQMSMNRKGSTKVSDFPEDVSMVGEDAFPFGNEVRVRMMTDDNMPFKDDTNLKETYSQGKRAANAKNRHAEKKKTSSIKENTTSQKKRKKNLKSGKNVLDSQRNKAHLEKKIRSSSEVDKNRDDLETREICESSKSVELPVPQNIKAEELRVENDDSVHKSQERRWVSDVHMAMNEKENKQKQEITLQESTAEEKIYISSDNSTALDEECDSKKCVKNHSMAGKDTTLKMNSMSSRRKHRAKTPLPGIETIRSKGRKSKEKDSKSPEELKQVKRRKGKQHENPVLIMSKIEMETKDSTDDTSASEISTHLKKGEPSIHGESNSSMNQYEESNPVLHKSEENLKAKDDKSSEDVKQVEIREGQQRNNPPDFDTNKIEAESGRSMVDSTSATEVSTYSKTGESSTQRESFSSVEEYAETTLVLEKTEENLEGGDHKSSEDGKQVKTGKGKQNDDSVMDTKIEKKTKNGTDNTSYSEVPTQSEMGENSTQRKSDSFTKSNGKTTLFGKSKRKHYKSSEDVKQSKPRRGKQHGNSILDMSKIKMETKKSTSTASDTEVPSNFERGESSVHRESNSSVKACEETTLKLRKSGGKLNKDSNSSERLKQKREDPEHDSSILVMSKGDMRTERSTSITPNMEVSRHFEIGESSKSTESSSHVQIYGERNPLVENSEKQDDNQTKTYLIDDGNTLHQHVFSRMDKQAVAENSRMKKMVQQLPHDSRIKYGKQRKKKENKKAKSLEESSEDRISNKKTKTVLKVKARARKSKEIVQFQLFQRTENPESEGAENTTTENNQVKELADTNEEPHDLRNTERTYNLTSKKLRADTLPILVNKKILKKQPAPQIQNSSGTKRMSNNASDLPKHQVQVRRNEDDNQLRSESDTQKDHLKSHGSVTIHEAENAEDKTTDQESLAIHPRKSLEEVENESSSNWKQFTEIPEEISVKGASVNSVPLDQFEDQDASRTSLRTVEDPRRPEDVDFETYQDENQTKNESSPKDCQTISSSKPIDSSNGDGVSTASVSPRSDSFGGPRTLSDIELSSLTQGLSHIEHLNTESDDQKSVYGTPPNLDMHTTETTFLNSETDIKAVETNMEEISPTTTSNIKHDLLTGSRNAETDEQQAVKPNSVPINATPTSTVYPVYDGDDIKRPFMDNLYPIPDPSDSMIKSHVSSMTSNESVSLEDLPAESTSASTSENYRQFTNNVIDKNDPKLKNLNTEIVGVHSTSHESNVQEGTEPNFGDKDTKNTSRHSTSNITESLLNKPGIFSSENIGVGKQQDASARNSDTAGDIIATVLTPVNAHFTESLNFTDSSSLNPENLERVMNEAKESPTNDISLTLETLPVERSTHLSFLDPDEKQEFPIPSPDTISRKVLGVINKSLMMDEDVKKPNVSESASSSTSVIYAEKVYPDEYSVPGFTYLENPAKSPVANAQPFITREGPMSKASTVDTNEDQQTMGSSSDSTLPIPASKHSQTRDAEVKGIHHVKTSDLTSSCSDKKFDHPQHSSTSTISKSSENFRTETLTLQNLGGGIDELGQTIKRPLLNTIHRNGRGESIPTRSWRDDNEGGQKYSRKDDEEEQVEKGKSDPTFGIRDDISSSVPHNHMDKVELQESSTIRPERVMNDPGSSSVSVVSSSLDNFRVEDSVPLSTKARSGERETARATLKSMTSDLNDSEIMESKQSVVQEEKSQDFVKQYSDDRSVSLDSPQNGTTIILSKEEKPEEKSTMETPGASVAVTPEANEELSTSSIGTEGYQGRDKVKNETDEKDRLDRVACDYTAPEVIHVASTSTSFSKNAIPTLPAPQAEDQHQQPHEGNKESTTEVPARHLSSHRTTKDETIGLQLTTFEHGVPLSCSELETEIVSTNLSNDLAPRPTSSRDFNTRRKLTPLTLGLETVGGVMTIVIPRNTTLPVHRRQLISTHTDNQTEVLVHIFEGERLWVRENMMLGSFEIKGISQAPRGEPLIPVRFEIDAQGILNVLLEKAERTREQTRRRLTLAISNVSVRPDRQKILQMIQDAEKHKAEDDEHKRRIQLKESFEDYVYRMRNIIVDKRLEKLVDPKEKEEMLAAVQSALNWVNVSNWLLYNKRHVPDFQEVNSQRKNLQKICDAVIGKTFQRPNNSNHIGS